MNVEKLGKKIENVGRILTIGVTIPIILFILGLFTLPFGIIFWIIGIILIGVGFSDKK